MARMVLTRVVRWPDLPNVEVGPVSFMYTPALAKLARADVDLEAADIRAIACMSNTTADTDRDAANLAAIATLDEYDGAGYTRQALTGETVNQDDANNRAEWTANPITFGSAVSAGTRSIVGILFYVRVDGTNANDWPLAWDDSGAFPTNGAGGALTVTPNAEGIVQFG